LLHDLNKVHRPFPPPSPSAAIKNAARLLLIVQFEEDPILLTRFQSSVRCVAFNATGSLVAAAGEYEPTCTLTRSDPEIKIITPIDQSVSQMTGHEGVIRSLVFDPDGEFLVRTTSTPSPHGAWQAVHQLQASSSNDGTVRVWALKTRTCVKTLNVLQQTNDLCVLNCDILRAFRSNSWVLFQVCSSSNQDCLASEWTVHCNPRSLYSVAHFLQKQWGAP
jgi:WD40 repeat protein